MQCATCTQEAFREKGTEVQLPLLESTVGAAVSRRTKSANYYESKKDELKIVRDEKRRGRVDDTNHGRGKAARVAPVFDRNRTALKTSLSKAPKKS